MKNNQMEIGIGMDLIQITIEFIMKIQMVKLQIIDQNQLLN